MFGKDTWQEIFETIIKNKLRTFLTGFAVTLGIFLYVVLSGMGNGLYNNYNNFFGEDALNIINILASETKLPYKGYKAKRQVRFNNNDLIAIEKRFAGTLDYITPRISKQSMITHRNKSGFYFTRGVSPGHLMAENSVMMRGRYINKADLMNRTNYAVIGRMVEKDLFEDESAVGKNIDISGNIFTVIGVFQDEGGDNEERFIYIPYTTVQQLEGDEEFNMMIVAYHKTIGFEQAMKFQDQLINFIKNRKIISPEDSGSMIVLNATKQYRITMNFANAIQFVVFFITIGIIISGIIGISNIMVFVVKQRTKEIGIRKAIGATPKVIAGNIMLESIFISSVFGIIGMILGMVTLSTLQGDRLSKEYLILNPGINGFTVVSVTLLLITCGAIAAYVPARRASRIKPIEALRGE